MRTHRRAFHASEQSLVPTLLLASLPEYNSVSIALVSSDKSSLMPARSSLFEGSLGENCWSARKLAG